MKKLKNFFVLLILLLGLIGLGCESPTDPIANLPEVKIHASVMFVPYNGTTTLDWSSFYATTCVASGDWSGDKSLSGTETIRNITAIKTFIITSTGPGGRAIDSVVVTIDVAPVPKIEKFEVTPSLVVLGTQVTLTWDTKNVIKTKGVNFNTNNLGFGSVKVIPTTTTTYGIICTGIDGKTVTKEVTATVTPISIGSYYKNGIIFSIDSSGQHGLVFEELPDLKNWEDAKKNASEKGGRLPSINELLLMYSKKIELGLEGSFYWSYEETSWDKRFALTVIFNLKPESNGLICNSFKEYTSSVLVIRSF